MAARPYAETAAALVRDGKVLMGLRAKWKRVWAGVWDAINICDEHDEIAWFTPDEVAAIDDLAGENYPELAMQAVRLVRDGWTG